MVETPRSRERKWARDPGSAAAAARRPAAVPLPRGLGPQDRAALQPPSTRWASVPESSAAGRGSRSGRLSGAEGRDEERQETEGKRGCIGGGWGGGDYVSFSPEGVSFIYLFF